jgi:hypothetical protein
MSKKLFSTFDTGQVLKSSFNHEGKGLDVFVRNGEVPVEFTYRTFSYDINENLVAIQYFTNGEREKTPAIVVGDISGSLSGTYFLIESIDTEYYLWFNTGSSIDPLVATRVGIEVLINENDSDIVIANKIADKLNEDGSDFVALSSDRALIIQNKRVGAVSKIQDVNTGIIFRNQNNGNGKTYVVGKNRDHKATKLMDYNDCGLVVSEEIVYHTEGEY